MNNEMNIFDPNLSCDCSLITESESLRNGCYNFLRFLLNKLKKYWLKFKILLKYYNSLGWNNPVVHYKKVTCPIEL